MDQSNFDWVLTRPRLACTSCKTNSIECLVHSDFKDVLRTSLINFKVKLVGRSIWVKTLIREKKFAQPPIYAHRLVFCSVL